MILQAAIGYGLFLMLIFGVGILLGIPVVTHSVHKRLQKKLEGKRTDLLILLLSIAISTIIIAFILSLTWIFYLSKIGLKYS